MLAIAIDKPKLRDFCRRWKITEFSFFGSVTRPEEFRDDSDIDVMVRFDGGAQWTLLDWVTMEAELAEIVGRPVDVVERHVVELSANRFRRRAMLHSLVALDVA